MGFCVASLFDFFRLGRAAWALAREGAFTLVDPEEVPAPMRLMARAARLVERRGAKGGKGLAQALDSSWPFLGQTRPVPCHSARRGGDCCRSRS